MSLRGTKQSHINVVIPNAERYLLRICTAEEKSYITIFQEFPPDGRNDEYYWALLLSWRGTKPSHGVRVLFQCSIIYNWYGGTDNVLFQCSRCSIHI